MAGDSVSVIDCSEQTGSKTPQIAADPYASVRSTIQLPVFPDSTHITILAKFVRGDAVAPSFTSIKRVRAYEDYANPHVCPARICVDLQVLQQQDEHIFLLL